jgi:hypothetical protein
MRSLQRFLLAGLLAALFAPTASAQFTLSEVFPNPPGADNGQEGFEIRGPANTSLSGYFLVIIEGDGTTAGIVDVVRSLSTLSTGSNGLLLLRDAANVILPAPDAATAIDVTDFNPDIENGTNTYVLGFGTPPAAGTDLDAGNDGTLDVPLTGFTVVDAVTIVESDGTANYAYADDLGGYVFPQFANWTPDLIYRLYNADGSACSWAGGDVAGTNPGGPYTWDQTFNPSFGGVPTVTLVGADLGTLNGALDTDGDGLSDACDPAIVALCNAGTGGVIACPCGNPPAGAGKGCDNSAATGGASITGSGAPALSADTLAFTTSNQTANGTTILLQGNALAGAGAGVAFGQGVRCVGGTLKRLYVRSPGGTGGISVPQVGDNSVSAQSALLGDVIAPGSTRYYMAYYRDPIVLGGCAASATFNATNALSVAWN